MTEWRGIVGNDKYKVSDDGQVMGPHGHILSPKVDKYGYEQVVVFLDGGRKMRTVHSLMMESFVGPRPDGYDICHNDGNSRNNTLSNLRYDTHANNISDMKIHGTNHNANKTHCPKGHEYNKENTHIGTKGERYCRTCWRTKNAERKYN